MCETRHLQNSNHQTLTQNKQLTRISWSFHLHSETHSNIRFFNHLFHFELAAESKFALSSLLIHEIGARVNPAASVCVCVCLCDRGSATRPPQCVCPSR